mmetsp:Transcript_730/g.2390  ORF Transcript_730/g.2390 Transcript_730/m.2390 type:complete len:192 (+) Transcript_730:117-692(+)
MQSMAAQGDLYPFELETMNLVFSVDTTSQTSSSFESFETEYSMQSFESQSDEAYAVYADVAEPQSMSLAFPALEEIQWGEALSSRCVQPEEALPAAKLPTPEIDFGVETTSESSKKDSKKKRKRSYKTANCPVCKKNFFRKYEMMRHVKATHLQLKPFHCPTCPRTFARKSHLKLHWNNIHEKSHGHLHLE